MQPFSSYLAMLK